MNLRVRSNSLRAARCGGHRQRVAIGCTWFKSYALLTVHSVVWPAAITNPKSQAGQFLGIEPNFDTALQAPAFDSAPSFLRSGSIKLVANSIGNFARKSEIPGFLIHQRRVGPRLFCTPFAKSIFGGAFDRDLPDRVRKKNPIALFDSE